MQDGGVEERRATGDERVALGAEREREFPAGTAARRGGCEPPARASEAKEDNHQNTMRAVAPADHTVTRHPIWTAGTPGGINIPGVQKIACTSSRL